MSSEEQATPLDAGDLGNDLEAVPLNKIERAGAASLGILATSAGSWAVFTTDNQAGSAVLILVGAAFCLMGLQGTPLIRFGSGDNSLELERRRKRRRVEIAVRTAESAQELEAIVEGASILDPGLVDTLAWQASIYETRVMLAIKSMGAIVSRLDSDITGADLSIRWNPDGSTGGLVMSRFTSGKTVEVVLKYLREGQNLGMSRIGRLGRPEEHFVPAIVIANAPISPALEEAIADGRIGVTRRDYMERR